MGVPSLMDFFGTKPPKSMLRWANRGWHLTPWWDWHRYRGGKMRSWCWDEDGLSFEYDGEYAYRSFEEHARKVLEEACDRV